MASKYTKRHYDDMAEFIRILYKTGHDDCAEACQAYWSGMYHVDNPLFDADRFRIACEAGVKRNG